MNRFFIPDGSYSFATLEGDWGSLIEDSHIISSRGRIELPKINNVPDNILFLTGATLSGKIVMAGQSHGGNGCMIYDFNGEWHSHGVAFGIQMVCFSQDGRFLYCVTSGDTGFYIDMFSGEKVALSMLFGVNGIRAIIPPTNKIIAGVETVFSPVYEMNEYVDFENNFVCGQAGQGYEAIHNNKRYSMRKGDCFVNRIMYDGSNIAYACVDRFAGLSDFLFCTVDELQLVSPPAIPPIPPIPPNPEPPEVDKPMAPNEIATIRDMMFAHPEIDTMDENERGKIIDYSCVELNPVNTVKPWGRKARNSDGSNKNTDAITFLRPDGKFEIYDVISGVDGSATWDGDGHPFNPGENGFWAPHEPVDGNVPPVPPTNPTDPIKVEKDDVRNGSNAIIAFYNEPIGLNRRARGIPSPIDVHDQACWDWIASYTTKLAEGKTPQVALSEVINQIKTFPEYIEQHP